MCFANCFVNGHERERLIGNAIGWRQWQTQWSCLYHFSSICSRAEILQSVEPFSMRSYGSSQGWICNWLIFCQVCTRLKRDMYWFTHMQQYSCPGIFAINQHFAHVYICHDLYMYFHTYKLFSSSMYPTVLLIRHWVRSMHHGQIAQGPLRAYF